RLCSSAWRITVHCPAAEHYSIPGQNQARQPDERTDHTRPLVGVIQAGLEQENAQCDKSEPCRYPACYLPPAPHVTMMARPPKAGRSLLQGHRNRYGDTPAAEG